MHPYSGYFSIRTEDDNLDVVDVLFHGLTDRAERPVLTFEGEQWSAGDIARQIRGIQGWLGRNGVQRGDRVALMLENHPMHVAFIYALMLSGVTWVPVNTRLKGPGVQYLVEHCRPRLVVGQRSFAEVIAEARRAATVEPEYAFLEDQRLFAPESPALQRAPVQAGDTLCIIYTSGTTGPPKGVVLTHRMMRIASEAALRVADARPGDRPFLWEPLCHIGGAQMLLTPFLEPIELHLVSRFSASRFWEQVTASKATQLHYLGGILDILMQLPASEQPAHHDLRVAWGAGVSAGAWQPIQQRMGCALRECYGMTECSSFATANCTGKPGSIGRALPWLRLELLDDADRPVPTGEIGQIVLSSDVEGVFMPGYLDNPEATAEALKGGKLYTGDLARRDAEGDLSFVGRRGDSMRVRGENVSAWEIERMCATHPAIAAAAAVGVKGTVGEQEILLYVQFRPGAVEDFAQLALWAAGRLASYQVPRYYLRVDAFETTPSERIRKHLLPRNLEGAWDSLTQSVPGRAFP